MSNGIFAVAPEPVLHDGPGSHPDPGAPPRGPADRIQIIESGEGPTEVRWRDKQGHLHRRIFETEMEAAEFAAQLACRLLIDDWAEENQRMAALARAKFGDKTGMRQ